MSAPREAPPVGATVMSERRVARAHRLRRANELITTIATCGREFLAHKGRVSWFEIDARGRVWFIDAYTERRIYTHYTGRWRGFTGGGTMKSLVVALAHWIAHQRPVPPHSFGPWPSWMCDGDPWAYGTAMSTVRERALALGIIETPRAVAA